MQADYVQKLLGELHRQPVPRHVQSRVEQLARQVLQLREEVARQMEQLDRGHRSSGRSSDTFVV